MAEHLLKGTYRPDRHGPLPPEVITGATAPQVVVPRLPKALMDGLGERGLQFTLDLLERYDDWTPANLVVLHEVGTVIDTLDRYAQIIARDDEAAALQGGETANLFLGATSRPPLVSTPHPLARLRAQAQRSLVLLLKQLDLKE
jgi:hypothetical protein